MKEQGFTLITSVLLVFVMSSLLALVFIPILDQWKIVQNMENLLYSRILAENGVEYARHLLSYLEIESLLEGLDGQYCDEVDGSRRSPLALEEAWQFVPESWSPSCDDGFPHDGERLLTVATNDRARKGYFLVRFSNNPEESSTADLDHVVLVRSIGMVPKPGGSLMLSEQRNFVCLVEARLRKEVLFLLRSPLTLFGDAGDFSLLGSNFSIQGDSQPAVSFVGISSRDLNQAFLSALSQEQVSCIQGQGVPPSLVDATDTYRAEPPYLRLYDPGFWEHFETQLADFADPFSTEGATQEGFYSFPEGGVLEGDYSGIIVAKGDLTLSAQARFSGLLLHLGNGRLTLTDQAEVRGGIWLSDLEASGGSLESGVISLQVSGFARIDYDREVLQRALTLLPVTQLGWRVIFPEMVSEG